MSLKATIYKIGDDGRRKEVFGGDFDTDSPPRPGDLLSHMYQHSTKHYRVLAIRHGVRMVGADDGRHTTVELLVEEAARDDFGK